MTTAAATTVTTGATTARAHAAGHERYQPVQAVVGGVGAHGRVPAGPGRIGPVGG